MNTRLQRPRIVAVVGGSGAGKTWFVRQVSALLGANACHLSLDDFYRDRSHLPLARRARLNFDIPGAIDWGGAADVLRDCRAGRATALPRYDFATYSRHPERRHWRPRPIVFVDGLWLLRPVELRPLFDLKLYLDTPTDLRLERRVARDTAERGYTSTEVLARLETMVLPMHERYVEPQKRWADLVLHQPYREEEVSDLADRLSALLCQTNTTDLPRESFRNEMLSALLQHEYAR